MLSGQNIEIIVSHQFSGSLTDRIFRSLVMGRPFVRYAQLNGGKTEGVKIAAMRNLGARQATTELLLFFDVDFDAGGGWLDKVLALHQESKRNFIVIPSLYLSPRGTRRFCWRPRNPDAPWKALEAFKAHRRDLVLYLAAFQSTILVNKAFFLSLGGFNEDFTNHGLEDQDLLVRMALAEKTTPVPRDLLEDSPSNSVAFSVSFRAYLLPLTVPTLLQGMFFVHRYHTTRDEKYYAGRKGNYLIFQDNVQGAIKDAFGASLEEEHDSFVNSLDGFERLTEIIKAAGCSVHEWSALFDNTPNFYFLGWREIRRLKALLYRLAGR
ncbi:MAG: galactosyltransferase-related protein, partial [Deltaproteobacteria bacterium]|nr:galactosyltransferase-related protein [Deltaproteobacteria bacterium]